MDNGSSSSSSAAAKNLPNWVRHERRKPRYAANLQVVVFTKGLNHFQSERTANISSGGVFVCTEHVCEVGEKLHVRVILSDIDSFFDVKVQVAWVCDGSGSHPQGLGLTFVDLSDEQRLVIEKVLKNYINVKDR